MSQTDLEKLAGERPDPRGVVIRKTEEVSEPETAPVNNITGQLMRTQYEHVDFSGVDFDTIENDAHLPTDDPELVFTKAERGSQQLAMLRQLGYREYTDPRTAELVGHEFQVMVLPRQVYDERYRRYLEQQANGTESRDQGGNEVSVTKAAPRPFGLVAAKLPDRDPAPVIDGIEA